MIQQDVVDPACRHGLGPAGPGAGRPTRGFTLIELMVTVAIVAVLAAIAYPAYTSSVIKGKRSEGRGALADLLLQQERYLTQTGSYMTFAKGATGAAGTTKDAAGVAIPFKTRSGDTAAASAYLLGAEPCPGGVSLNSCVRVFAEPQFSDPQAANLRMTSTGVRDCTGSYPGVCWK